MAILSRFCFHVAKNTCLLLKKCVDTHRTPMEKCTSHTCIISPDLQSEHTCVPAAQIKNWDVTSSQETCLMSPSCHFPAPQQFLS